MHKSELCLLNKHIVRKNFVSFEESNLVPEPECMPVPVPMQNVAVHAVPIPVPEHCSVQALPDYIVIFFAFLACTDKYEISMYEINTECRKVFSLYVHILYTPLFQLTYYFLHR